MEKINPFLLQNRQRLLLLLLLPCCLSLILNLIYLWEHDWGWKLVNPYTTSDAYLYRYNAWYKAFVHSDGGFLGQVIPFSLYIELLTGLYKIFGSKIWVPYLLTIPFTALTASIVALLTCRVLNFRSGIIAGCLFAFSGVFIFFSGLTYKTSLVIFLASLSTWLCIIAISRKSLLFVLVAAISIGITSLDRNNFLIMVFPLVIFFVINHPVSFRWRIATLTCTAVFAGILIANMLPRLTSDSNFNESASYLGINYYVGNRPESNGGYTSLKDVPNNIIGHRYHHKLYVEKQLGYKPSNIDLHTYWIKDIVQFIIENPWNYFLLELKKVGLLFAQYAYGHPDLYAQWRWTSIALTIAIIDWGLIFALCLVGLYFLWSLIKHDKNLQFLLTCWILYALSLVFMFIAERYRLYLYIIMLVPAAYTIDSIWRAFEQKKSIVKPTLSITILLALSISLNNLLVPYGSAWPVDFEKSREKLDSQRNQEILSVQQQNRAVNQNDREAWLYIATEFSNRGFYKDALSYYDRVLQITPKDLDVLVARNNLARKVISGKQQ